MDAWQHRDFYLDRIACMTLAVFPSDQQEGVADWIRLHVATQSMIAGDHAVPGTEMQMILRSIIGEYEDCCQKTLDAYADVIAKTNKQEAA